MCTQRPPTIVATTATSGSSDGSHVERIAIEHDEVGEVPGQELPAPALVAGQPRGRDDRRVQRLLHRDRLLGSPRGPLVERAEDPGADPGPRIELLDRRVGAVGDDGAGLDERPERVRAGEALRPEALREVAVGRGVAELD